MGHASVDAVVLRLGSSPQLPDESRKATGGGTQTSACRLSCFHRIHAMARELAAPVLEPDKVGAFAGAIFFPSLVLVSQTAQILSEISISDAFHAHRVPRTSLLSDVEEPLEGAFALRPDFYAGKIQAKKGFSPNEVPAAPQVDVHTSVAERAVHIQGRVGLIRFEEAKQVSIISFQCLQRRHTENKCDP
jgi:hypothetical protein